MALWFNEELGKKDTLTFQSYGVLTAADLAICCCQSFCDCTIVTPPLHTMELSMEMAGETVHMTELPRFSASEDMMVVMVDLWEDCGRTWAEVEGKRGRILAEVMHTS